MQKVSSLKNSALENTKHSDRLNQTIWIYWDSGMESAPEVVQKCVASWRYYHPDYTINVLSNNSIQQYFVLENVISTSYLKRISVAAQSDIIRIHLLSKYGGIWVDATLMCLKPLEEWIYPFLTSSGFFAFNRPGPDRMISSWFLVAKANSYIPQLWSASVRDYWATWKFRRKYYWFHYLFNSLYEKDVLLKEEWDSVRKLSADGPHFFVPFKKRFFETAVEEKIESFELLDLPVVKLTYKCLKDGYPKGSMIDYLLNVKKLN